MNRVKTISRILYYLSALLALIYSGMALYSVVCLLTGWNLIPYGEGKYLHILYPFTSKPFLNIDNNLPYMLFSFLLPLTLYGLFFWITCGVFRVFHQPRLFTAKNVTRLRQFYGFNLIAPVSAVLLAAIFVPVESPIWALVVVHLLLGVFAYFFAVIFRQGLQLQNEQDLFI
ncbi:DUF2975 domain-containing protein [Taibaiella chishuiensis]|uniref:DUF2975 family protein n=1 Tax=Taibaiella chishuiensis TaxID=1434707 RepID=A0A2P8D1P2_9BACT|nr:DUF2975 domain-containing protein [Taibaiella chishuiensis]PSK91135.1 Protein of unknown function (DUF2975) [Taibaiella chishuiensis]